MEPKPCPSCVELPKKVYNVTIQFSGDGHQVRCECGVSGPFGGDREEAIMLWDWLTPTPKRLEWKDAGNDTWTTRTLFGNFAVGGGGLSWQSVYQPNAIKAVTLEIQAFSQEEAMGIAQKHYDELVMGLLDG